MAKTRLEKIVTKHLGYVAAGYENEVADGHRKIEELPDATELRYDVFEDIKASEGLDVRREDRFFSNTALMHEIKIQIAEYRWEVDGSPLVSLLTTDEVQP